MNKIDPEKVLEVFHRRYRIKKQVNIAISCLIVLLGVSSFIYGLHIEPGVTIFRFMTVDGTLFMTFGAIVFIAVNTVEILRRTELTSELVYFIRLSGAVAEAIIFIVVVTSHLPFFSEHLTMFDRYDSFVMHVLIPILGISSFVLNDSPIGRPGALKLLNGTWFITVYAVIIFSLIASRALASEQIPYFFLDYRNTPPSLLVTAFVFIYGAAWLMSMYLAQLNRRLSWTWFRDIARD